MSPVLSRIHHYEFPFQAFWKLSKNRLFILDGRACLNGTVIVVIIHIYCIFLKDALNTYFTFHGIIMQLHKLELETIPLTAQTLHIFIKWEILCQPHLLKSDFSTSLQVPSFITRFFPISTVAAWGRYITEDCIPPPAPAPDKQQPKRV